MRRRRVWIGIVCLGLPALAILIGLGPKDTTSSLIARYGTAGFFFFSPRSTGPDFVTSVVAMPASTSDRRAEVLADLRRLGWREGAPQRHEATIGGARSAVEVIQFKHEPADGATVAVQWTRPLRSSKDKSIGILGINYTRPATIAQSAFGRIKRLFRIP